MLKIPHSQNNKLMYYILKKKEMPQTWNPDAFIWLKTESIGGLL
jgi:hypothetical protein